MVDKSSFFVDDPYGGSRKYLRYAQKLSEVSLAVEDGLLRCKSVKRSVCSFPIDESPTEKAGHVTCFIFLALSQ